MIPGIFLGLLLGALALAAGCLIEPLMSRVIDGGGGGGGSRRKA